jgi:hypothetical protein
MNKILITSLLCLLWLDTSAQTKAKKTVQITQPSATSPYSISLQVGGYMTYDGEGYGLQFGTAFEYHVGTFLALRSRLFGYHFTENLLTGVYVPLVVPPDPPIIYRLALEEQNRHAFWTFGPVFQIGRKWQCTVSPQAGVKASFVTLNLSESGVLAEARHFKSDYNFTYGMEAQLWYAINAHLKIGIGIDEYRHKMSRNIAKIEYVGQDLSDPSIQNPVQDKIKKHQTEFYQSFNASLKYRF